MKTVRTPIPLREQMIETRFELVELFLDFHWSPIRYSLRKSSTFVRTFGICRFSRERKFSTENVSHEQFVSIEDSEKRIIQLYQYNNGGLQNSTRKLNTIPLWITDFHEKQVSRIPLWNSDKEKCGDFMEWDTFLLCFFKATLLFTSFR